MPENRIRANQDLFLRLAAEDIKRGDGNYGSFKGSLENLVNAVENCFEQGGYQQLSSKDLDKLEAMYREVIHCGTDVLRFDDKEIQGRKALIEGAVRSAYKDYRAIVNVRKEKAVPENLKEAFQQGRTAKIYLDEKSLKSVSGAMSRRLPVKTKNGTKGFFTEKSYKQRLKACDDLVKHYGANLPDFMVKEIKDHYTAGWSKIEGLLQNGGSSVYAAYFDVDDNLVFNLAKLGGFSSDFSKELKNNNETFRAVREIFKGFATVRANVEAGYSAGIGGQAETSMRNVMLYNVADRLGVGNLVAKAVPMTVVTENTKANGVFIENVEGVNSGKVFSADHPFLKAEYSGNALKQLAEMQMLDYICGNIDRHSNNLAVTIEKDENGKDVITSVKGFDNDLSFGTITENRREMVPVSDMKVISEGMAEAVKNADFNELAVYLKSEGLDAREIAAFCRRIGDVRSAVESGRIEVVKDTEWDSKKLADLAVIQQKKHPVTGETLKRGSNLFAKMVLDRETRLDQLSKNQPVLDKDGEPDFAQELEADAEQMENTSEKIKLDEIIRKSEEMRKLDKFYIPSTEFKKMRDSFFRLEDLARTQLREGGVSNEDFKKAGEELAQASKHYLDLKKLAPSTEHGQKRQAFAVDAAALALSVKERGFMSRKHKDAPEVENEGPEI